MKIEARQRFTSDADLEDDSLQMPRRPASLRSSSSSAPARRPAAAARWLSLPTALAVLALLALCSLVYMWGLTASVGGGGAHHPPLTTPFANETMVQFTTKFGTFAGDR